MIVDGNALAKQILAQVAEEVRTAHRQPTLLALVASNDPATRSYLAIKSRFAEAAGIVMRVEMVENPTTESLVARATAAKEDGVIIQLPLPQSIDTDAVLAAVTVEQDADVLSPSARERALVLPPVATAVAEILHQGGVVVSGAQATVIGAGRLVGEPVAKWLRENGAVVEVVTKEEGSLTESLSHADIIVAGAGTPGLVTADMVRQGVVILDAGTSEQGGVIAGDVDPGVAEVASLFTPVPGGIGPVAVACLMRNVAHLASYKS
jgi:methylenetetrahydrofolate dehydrogenase (NADP+)/methenyltetrahydrofolate cyclohydrolase